MIPDNTRDNWDKPKSRATEIVRRVHLQRKSGLCLGRGQFLQRGRNCVKLSLFGCWMLVVLVFLMPLQSFSPCFSKTSLAFYKFLLFPFLSLSFIPSLSLLFLSFQFSCSLFPLFLREQLFSM